MTNTERLQKIESYGKATIELETALKTFPRETWKFKPTPEKWSVHEIIVHLADSEANSYIRARRFIAEPGLSVMAYDQDRWATELCYHDQSTDDYLALFRSLRGTTYHLIKNLPENVWSNTIDHPENGIMTMDDWLDTYEQHVRVHVAQMKRNLEEWKKNSVNN